jgi:radical SAM superfamily enzyme YgiQ (UPF0313 family)
MKIALILPSIGKIPGQKYIRAWQMEPLSIAQLAALTPKDIEVIFFDDRMEAVDYDVEVDLVAISIETYTAYRAYQIASEFRKRNRTIVMGGFHATLCPDEVAGFADAVVTGQAEGSWKMLLKDFENGSLKKFYKTENIPENELNILPDRSIYGNRNYVNIRLLEAGRGCKFRCEFCSIQQFFEGKHFKKNIEIIVKDAAELRKDKTLLFFVDDNIVSDVPFARELFKALVPLKIKWVGQADITIARDPQLLKLMAESGCQGVLIGFESLNPDNLKLMNKTFNAVDGGPEKAVKIIHQHGLRLYATFLYGYKNDTKEDFEGILNFCIKNRIFMVGFNHLTPFPGTRLYDRLKNENLLLYEKWWLSEDYRYGQIPFKTSIDHRFIEEQSKLARKRFYSFRSIFYRMTNLTNISNPAMFLYYFSINLLLKNDAGKRMKFPLGDRSKKYSLLKSTT